MTFKNNSQHRKGEQRSSPCSLQESKIYEKTLKKKSKNVNVKPGLRATNTQGFFVILFFFTVSCSHWYVCSLCCTSLQSFLCTQQGATAEQDICVQTSAKAIWSSLLTSSLTSDLYLVLTLCNGVAAGSIPASLG